jgi:predicted AlkP superfamily phosphohydrolase/phosphomutase
MARTLVVGFDGATLSLCDRWIAEGRMPTLAGLMADGSHGVLRSVFPYNSAVAWATLATGTNAGRHGIFDFVLPREGAYALKVTTREDRRVPALWNHASDAGASVAVVNIPMTFPAETLNGVMISGMDAPSLEQRAVSPPELLGEIHRLQPDYRIMSKAYIRAEHGEWEAAERELVEVMENRARLVAELARRRSFDLLMVNLEATDGSHHFFWQHLDPGHPRHDPALAGRFGDTIGRVYEASDRELARLIDAHRPDTVFVVSDHGGGPSNDWVVYMNDWLAEEGLLAIRPSAKASAVKRAYAVAMRHMSAPLKRRLRPLFGRFIERAKGLTLYGDVDWSGSKAYATIQSMVRLNLRGREPEGIVDPSETAAVLEELGLRAVDRRFPDGRPLFTLAARAEEIYRGDVPGRPDFVVEPEQGTEVRGRNTSGHRGFLHRLADLGAAYYPSGVHTPEGVVIAAGSGIERRGRVAESGILQVAPSVLASLGVPAPALEAEPFPFVSATLRSTGAALATGTPVQAELSDQEEAEVLERLRGLGYVD